MVGRTCGQILQIHRLTEVSSVRQADKQKKVYVVSSLSEVALRNIIERRVRTFVRPLTTSSKEGLHREKLTGHQS